MGTSTFSTVARDIYDLAYQISPILLKDGIASSTPGGYLPLFALIGAGTALFQSALSGKISPAQLLADAFARFLPMPGSTIVAQTVGTYPYANIHIASNATIQQPLTLSLRMISPVNSPGGYLTKLPIFMSIANRISSHNAQGGSYTILTPAKIYTDGLLTGITDITGGETKQVQVEWQWDFFFPLISVSAATSAKNALAKKISGGNKITSSATSGVTSFVSGSAVPGASSILPSPYGSLMKYVG